MTLLLCAALLVAQTVAANFPPAGTYRYSAALGAQRIGEWSVSVKNASSQIELDENSSASFAGMQLSATASLLLGSDLSPVSYSGKYRTPMQNLSPVVTLTATSATVAGSVTKGVSLIGGTRHFVAIEPGLLAGLFALPAQVTAWKETSFTWITPATGEAQLLSLNPTSATPAPSNVPARDAVLAIDRPIAVTIWYDPSTLVPDEIAAPSQNAVLTRERP